MPKGAFPQRQPFGRQGTSADHSKRARTSWGPLVQSRSPPKIRVSPKWRLLNPS